MTRSFPVACRRHLPLLITVLAQYSAAILGIAYGFAQLYFDRWIPNCYSSFPPNVNLPAAVSAAGFFIESIRYFASTTLRRKFLITAWLCLALGLFTALLMLSEPFLHYESDVAFIINIHILIIFLIAIGPLVKARAWLGATAAITFFVVSLAMLIDNAFSIGGQGFLTREAH